MSNKLQKRSPHGIYNFLRMGKIQPSVRGAKRMQAILRDIEADLIRDLGGPAKMTTAQEVLVKITMQAFGVLILAGAWTQRYGVLRPDMAKRGVLELQPVLGKQYIAFLNSIRQNLALLGLGRAKADEVLDLTAYIRAKDAEKSETKARKASSTGRAGQAEAGGPGRDDKAGPGIVPLRAPGDDVSGQPESGIDCPTVDGQDRGSGPNEINDPGAASEGEGQGGKP